MRRGCRWGDGSFDGTPVPAVFAVFFCSILFSGVFDSKLMSDGRATPYQLLHFSAFI
ncbi:hypothetical protein K449DRAFT_391274 [Hypoxylon sp. EC38]|nr:hypothetical protein K449DRAFT_391274 [Hypoxylon sp. EC38]